MTYIYISVVNSLRKKGHVALKKKEINETPLFFSKIRWVTIQHPNKHKFELAARKTI